MTSTGQATISGRHGETGSIRDRSPEHHELRAYNALTGTQVTRTLLAPRSEKGSGTRVLGPSWPSRCLRSPRANAARPTSAATSGASAWPSARTRRHSIRGAEPCLAREDHGVGSVFYVELGKDH